jgi:hypothetical protein
MRLPRMTTRRWILAVAVVAVLFAVEADRRCWPGRRRFRAMQAERHAVMCLWASVGLSDDGVVLGGPEAVDESRAQYHRRMELRWKQAEARPWLPVGPDPPVPK